jgi:protein-disulfide isomerase
VRMQDPTGKKYLDFHQKLLGGRGAADKARAMAAAKEAGLDMAEGSRRILRARKCAPRSRRTSSSPKPWA